MPANKTILWGCSLDYSAAGDGLGASYVTGGTIAGSALATFQTNIGKNVSIMHIGGHAWMQSGVFNTFSIYTTNLNILTAAGILPCIDWLPFDSGGNVNDFALRPARIAAGDWDTQITAYANAIKAWGKNICIRMFVEPNITGQYSWQYGPTGTWTVDVSHQPSSGYSSGTWTNTAADVNGALQRIGNIFKNVVGCTNAKLIANYNIVSTSATMPLATQFTVPFDLSNFVDIISIDGYCDAGATTTRPDFAAIFRGGGTSNLQDTYGQLAALHPTMPLMISETGWAGTVGSAVAITSITRTGGSWAIVTGSAMSAEAVAGAAFDIQGTVPTTYRGQWQIAVRTDSTHFTVTGDSDHGAVTTVGTIQTIDRVNRAIYAAKSLETDLPTMTRIEYLLLFWVRYNANNWTMDYYGTQANNLANPDMLALAKAIGNAHYLEGQTLGTDVSAVPFIPYQDQDLSASGALERYRAVARSTYGCFTGWLMNQTVGTTPIPDDVAGGARTLTVNGTASVGNTNVIPSEPTWTSGKVSGTSGNHFSAADAAVFSPVTSGKLAIVFSYLNPTDPSGTGVLIGKGGSPNNEWAISLTTTTLLFSCFQNLPTPGNTYASSSFTLPARNVPHHVVACVDTANTGAPVTFYVDGVQHTSGAASGTMADLAAGITIGQRGDATQFVPADTRYGPIFFFNQILTPESAADLYAVWQAGPVITLLTAS